MSVGTKNLQLTEKQGGKIIEVHVQGKLTKDDYRLLAPEVERLIQEHGKLRVLFYMQNFEGWSAMALWEDVKFDAKHFNDVERVALVGDAKWEQGMAAFCKPFTTGEVRYFKTEQLAEARQWIEQ